MVQIEKIERKTPLGFEVLLRVNGAIGRAEEMLCLEQCAELTPCERPSKKAPILVLVPTAEYALSGEKL